jgi:hypothetical protein
LLDATPTVSQARFASPKKLKKFPNFRAFLGVKADLAKASAVMLKA